jgi:hypothetical protein
MLFYKDLSFLRCVSKYFHKNVSAKHILGIKIKNIQDIKLFNKFSNQILYVEEEKDLCQCSAFGRISIFFLVRIH